MIGMPGRFQVVAKTQGPSDSKIKKAENEFRKMVDSGKVKDLNQARKVIRKKYGINPNGMTN